MNKVIVMIILGLTATPLAADQQQACEASSAMDADNCRAESGGGSGDLDAEIPEVMDNAGDED